MPSALRIACTLRRLVSHSSISGNSNAKITTAVYSSLYSIGDSVLQRYAHLRRQRPKAQNSMRQQTAAAAEVHVSVRGWLLRECLDKMTASDIEMCSREILKAKSVTNQAVEQLGIGTLEPTRDASALLYAREHYNTVLRGVATPLPHSKQRRSH